MGEWQSFQIFDSVKSMVEIADFFDFDKTKNCQNLSQNYLQQGS